MSIEEFNLKSISSKIKQILADDAANIEGCRDFYLESIMEWSDYYTEVFQDNTSDPAAQSLLRELVSLWISYADFEANLRQFKKATDVYDKAMGDPIVGKIGRIYFSNASFCLSRNKPASAQKAYLAGLCAGLTAQDNKKLWQDLLALIRDVTKNTTLSLEELYENVQKEVGQGKGLAPLPSLDDLFTAEDQDEAPAAPDTAQGMEMGLDVAESKMTEDSLPSDRGAAGGPERALGVGGAGGAEGGDMWGSLTPEQLVRAFRFKPFLLFVAPHKEPMKSGLGGLREAERGELERFLSCPLSALDSPRSEQLLDILEGQWLAQALQEREFEQLISQLNALHLSQDQHQPLAQLSEPDRKKVLSRWAVQREVLQAHINKTLYILLLEQQRCLSALHFPTFSPAFTEQLEKVPRSHMASPSSSQSTQFFSPILLQNLVQQQRLVCSLLSLRLHQTTLRTPNKLSRGMSVESEGSQGVSVEDYYSQEAKKQRKRRRSVQEGGEAYGGALPPPPQLNVYVEQRYPVGGV